MVHRLLLRVWSHVPHRATARLFWLLSAKPKAGVVAIILRHDIHELRTQHTYKPAVPCNCQAVIRRQESTQRMVCAASCGGSWSHCDGYSTEGVIESSPASAPTPFRRS